LHVGCSYRCHFGTSMLPATQKSLTHLHLAYYVYMGWSRVKDLKSQWEKKTDTFFLREDYCPYCNLCTVEDKELTAWELYPDTFNWNVWEWLHLHGVQVKFPEGEPPRWAPTGEPLGPPPLRAMTRDGDFKTPCVCGSYRGGSRYPK